MSLCLYYPDWVLGGVRTSPTVQLPRNLHHIYVTCAAAIFCNYSPTCSLYNNSSIRIICPITWGIQLDFLKKWSLLSSRTTIGRSWLVSALRQLIPMQKLPYSTSAGKLPPLSLSIPYVSQFHLSSLPLSVLILSPYQKGQPWALVAFKTEKGGTLIRSPENDDIFKLYFEVSITSSFLLFHI